MPIYEYQCGKCGEIFEKIQRVDEDEDSLTCPYCGKEKPEKVLSSFSSSKGSESATTSCGSSSDSGGSSKFS